MKTVILGAVAAGTKTAAKLKREKKSEEVVIYTKSSSISYAGCGLPYYVGGDIEEEAELTVNTPEKFEKLTGVPVHTNSEATKVDFENRIVEINHIEKIPYDRLVIAVGAHPVVPPIEGACLEGVFTVRTVEDAVSIRSYTEKCKKAVVVGASFIGLEIAENLMKKGISVTLVDMAPQILPEIFDVEMADYMKRSLQKKGLRTVLSSKLEKIVGMDKVEAVETNSGKILTDMVILAMGIRPSTKFLENSGLSMEKGCILTDEYGKTNIENVYAVGDCARIQNRITKKGAWSPMGSTANIAGRSLALNLAGEQSSYEGVLSTAIIHLSEDLNAAKTGLTEKAALENGYEVCTVVAADDDKPHYYPGASTFYTKLIAEKHSGRLLGMQVVGSGNVDKMCDIAVVGISAKLNIHEFISMDFAYAPPFSTAIHPFAVACTVLQNKMEGKMESITPLEYMEGKAEDYTLIDAHPKNEIQGAEWLSVSNLEQFTKAHSKEEKILLVCYRGKNAYLMQNRLKALGFLHTKVLEAGSTFSTVKKVLPKGALLPPSEIKRVKGLGCLQDKRFNDVFNVRVITTNGKITTEEHRAIAEAAERFGSGEITMTTRLTMEIQGVKYENIDALIAFLGDYGLETGGTGSLVRPVVSCKGTTCQYGLIDTFALSEKIHERFYKGYHHVTLPHKFKIAVGGCPNNCVKPNLNDLGIVGQRVPLFDFSKCRGCKVCQVEKSCPIKVAKLKDGVLSVDPDSCNGCGRCKNKCPFGVTAEYQNGYRIYIGGRFGKKVAFGKPLSKLFTSEEEVLDVVEKAILFFRNEGITGERFADTVNRLGFEYAEEQILYKELNKSAVLDKKVTGGATC